MIEVETYHNTDKLKIPVNNHNFLQVELIKTDKKENNQYLKITRLNENGDREKTEFINEGDLVLFWNLYIYKKEHKEPIF